MLIQHHAVETQFVGVDEVIDVFLVELAGAVAIPQLFGTVTQPVS